MKKRQMISCLKLPDNHISLAIRIYITFSAKYSAAFTGLIFCLAGELLNEIEECENLLY